MRRLPLIAIVIWLAAGVGCGGPLPPPDPPNLAGAKDSLARGNEYYSQGCLNAAERYYQAGLDHARLSDDVLLIIRALNNLGTVTLAQNRPDTAAAYLEQAMNISLGQPGQPEMDKILGNFGALALRMKRYADAEDFWQKAADAASERGFSPAPYLCDLARLYLATGREADFTAMTARALEVAQKGTAPANSDAEPLAAAADPATVADALSLAGTAAHKAGNLAAAENYYHQALELDRKTENTAGLAQDTEALAMLVIAQGRYQEAVSLLDRAFFLWMALGDDISRDRVYGTIQKSSREHKTPKELLPYQEARKNSQAYRLTSQCP